MSFRRFVPSLILIVVALAIAIACARPLGGKGGDPGGPIIVIKPSPEPITFAATSTDYSSPFASPSPSPSPQCSVSVSTGPCWYEGSFDDDHWNHLPDWIKQGDPRDSPVLPYYLAMNPIHRMLVRWNNGDKQIEIYGFQLTLANGDVLKVTLNGTPPAVSVWNFDTKDLIGLGGNRHYLSTKFMKPIQALQVMETVNGSFVSKDIAKVDQLMIYYEY